MSLMKITHYPKLLEDVKYASEKFECCLDANVSIKFQKMLWHHIQTFLESKKTISIDTLKSLLVNKSAVNSTETKPIKTYDYLTENLKSLHAISFDEQFTTFSLDPSLDLSLVSEEKCIQSKPAETEFQFLDRVFEYYNSEYSEYFDDTNLSILNGKEEYTFESMSDLGDLKDLDAMNAMSDLNAMDDANSNTIPFDVDTIDKDIIDFFDDELDCQNIPNNDILAGLVYNDIFTDLSTIALDAKEKSFGYDFDSIVCMQITKKQVTPEKSNTNLKKVSKITKKCIHLKQKNKCVECKGSSTCEHFKIKYACIQCKGSSICIHSKLKYTCIKCKGSAVCVHAKIRYDCKFCNVKKYCEHAKQRVKCSECKQIRKLQKYL